MRHLLNHPNLLTLIFLAVCFSVQSQPVDTAQHGPVQMKKGATIYVFDIDEDIFKPAQRKLNRALEEADSANADLIVMRLNTYGGAVDVADDMRTKLLNLNTPTMVFITNNAASAGALLSIACDSIYMKPEATIGAAVVVEGGTGDAASEKYQSYFREKFRATAEQKGRDPDIAEAMVNPDVDIEGVIKEGKILTLTASEALRVDFCDGIVNDLDEALAMAGYEDYSIIEYRPSLVDKVIGFFTNPMVSGILLTVIFFGIFFELQTPGIGFPLLAAILAAVFYFTPLYMDGLAENWEIAVFVIGLVLIGLELFVIPGFGIAGIAGLVMVIGGLTLSMLQNIRFDFTFTGAGEISQALVVVLGAILLTVIGAIFLARNLQSSRVSNKIVFRDTQQSDKGYQVDSFRGQDLLHKTGIAVTALRPAGKVEIGNDRYDAYTNGEWIQQGDEVIVVRAKGISLIVAKV